MSVESRQGNVRFLGLSLEHSDAGARLRGEESFARLTISRGLKSGKVDDVPLTEDELVKLIADAADALRILRGLR
jgi:hypothetical protein